MKKINVLFSLRDEPQSLKNKRETFHHHAFILSVYIEQSFLNHKKIVKRYFFLWTSVLYDCLFLIIVFQKNQTSTFICT